MNRREFLEAGALGLGGLVVGPRPMQPLSSGGSSEVSDWVSEPEIGGVSGLNVEETIGGWTIGSVALFRDGGTAATSAGLAPNDYPFYSGAAYADRATAPYRVTTAGVLNATGAIISGTITATAGTIGGFTLSATALYAGTTVTRIQLDTTSGIHLGATAFADAPFRVSLAGALVATSATITGTINATAGYFGSVDSSVLIDSTGVTLLGSGHVSTAVTGARVEMVVSGLKWWDATTQRGQILSDGSGWLGASGSFSWTALGVVSMDGAFINNSTITSGKLSISQLSAITADMGSITAGTITGGTIQTAASGARVVLGTTGVLWYDATTQRGQILNDGSGWLGSSTAFAWTTAGVLTAGGWTLAATTLTGGNVVLDSAGVITIRPSAGANSRFIFQVSGETYPRSRIYMDSTANQFRLEKLDETTGAVQTALYLASTAIGLFAGSDGFIIYNSTGATQLASVSQTGRFFPGNQLARYLYDAGATSGLAIAGGPFSTTGNFYPGTGSALQTTRYLYDTGTHTGISGGLYLAGGQLAFPAVQAASADANTLDDYEEGTWTPSVGGNATYTTQTGRYVKVGKMVFLYCDIRINVLGTGSTTTISGLPFTNATGADASPGSVGYYSSLATSVVFLVPVVNDSATTVKFESNAASATTMTDSTVVFGNGARIVWSVVYEASA